MYLCFNQIVQRKKLVQMSWKLTVVALLISMNSLKQGLRQGRLMHIIVHFRSAHARLGLYLVKDSKYRVVPVNSSTCSAKNIAH